MMDFRTTEDEDEPSEMLQRAEHDYTDDESIALNSNEGGEVIEQYFALKSFLWKIGIADSEAKKTSVTLLDTTKNNILFEELRITTCAKQTSVISDGQYQSCCRTFILPY